jgi:hypothetical protein
MPRFSDPARAIASFRSDEAAHARPVAGVASGRHVERSSRPRRPEHAAGVRLHLGSVAYGDGPSLQEAADDLVRRALAIGRALRTSGFAVSTELPYDMAALSLLAELDEIAAAAGTSARGSSARSPSPDSGEAGRCRVPDLLPA